MVSGLLTGTHTLGFRIVIVLDWRWVVHFKGQPQPFRDALAIASGPSLTG
ncbi:MAG: hypothetical protein G8237_13500 [Magnetococcales bacterium]|nr:hypothetical protein [Magnetococcales bacterium]